MNWTLNMTVLGLVATSLSINSPVVFFRTVVVTIFPRATLVPRASRGPLCCNPVDSPEYRPS